MNHNLIGMIFQTLNQIQYLIYVKIHQLYYYILFIYMKKRLSPALLEGINILQNKNQAENVSKEIQSARKLIQEEFIDDYGLKNKKLRFKKQKKEHKEDLITQTIEERKQANSKFKIDLKTPLLEISDSKMSKLTKKTKKDESKIYSSQKNNDQLRSSRLTKTKSILSKCTKKSQRSDIKSIVGRISNGDQEKEKLLIEICRKNLNEQLFEDEDIFGIKNNHNVSRRNSLDKNDNKLEQLSIVTKDNKKPNSNTPSQKQTAMCTKIPNSMENSYIQQQQKKIVTKIIINPFAFNYQQECNNLNRENNLKTNKPFRNKVIKGKNCYTQVLDD